MRKLFHHSKRPMVRHLGLILCGAVAICWLWASYGGSQPTVADESDQRKTLRSLPPRPAVSDAPETQAGDAEFADVADDEELRRRVIGTWEDDYRGKRTMTLREDGTATMIVELDGVGAALFADKLTFDIEWKIERGVMSLKTIGGTPEKKIALVSRIYGDEAEELIIELTDDRLLVEHDEDTDFDWRRVKTGK